MFACAPTLLAAGGGGEFSPSQIFATHTGAWYDPSDLSTLFQDNAGAVPVTAAGQPVGRINDKSGSGNHLLHDAVNPNTRPTLQSESGKFYLSFDGGDYLARSGATGLGDGGATTVLFIASLDTDAGNGLRWSYFRGLANPNQCRAALTADNRKITATFAAGDMLGAIGTSLSSSVATRLFTTGNNRMWLNKSELLPVLSMTPNTVTGEIILGGRPASGSERWVGRVYGAIEVNGSLSDTEISNMQDWLMAKTGI